jgi:hypothetical protein
MCPTTKPRASRSVRCAGRPDLHFQGRGKGRTFEPRNFSEYIELLNAETAEKQLRSRAISFGIRWPRYSGPGDVYDRLLRASRRPARPVRGGGTRGGRVARHCQCAPIKISWENASLLTVFLPGLQTDVTGLKTDVAEILKRLPPAPPLKD